MSWSRMRSASWSRRGSVVSGSSSSLSVPSMRRR
nr:MAG TPA: hypothetical protein [Caudoviricetes sp.]